jgi:hypothetical protein
MVRQVKSKSSESTPTPSTVVEKVAVPAQDVKVKATKKPKVEVAPATNTVVDVVASATHEVLSTENVVHSDTDINILEQSTELLAKLQQVGNLISAIKVEYRVLEKKWQRELKTAQKQSSKRKRKSGNRQPSGFVKPTRIVRS